MHFVMLALVQICERFSRNLPTIISQIREMACKDNSFAGKQSPHTLHKHNVVPMVARLLSPRNGLLHELKVISFMGPKKSFRHSWDLKRVLDIHGT